jgi:RNA polymerase sigma factor (sigma-70 family)
MTDEHILLLARNPRTREEGFRLLVRTYQERLYHCIRRQLPSHDDADDVLQNTFMKVFRHLDHFEGKSSLYTWMYRIAQNEVFDQRKRMSKYKAEDESKAKAKAKAKDEAKAEVYVNMDNLSAQLESAVQQLPERQQMVFRMRYYDELPYKDIAEMLHLTEGALKASFHHAVKKIEEQLRTSQLI